jgi:uncharacterized protein (TIGR02118 family)
MVKFMVIFYKPRALDAFEQSYNEFLALVERMPSILRRQVIAVTGSPQGESPYYRILEVYFDDYPIMQSALTSAQGQEAAGQLMTFPAGAFEMVFADVWEEAGGRTPPSTYP